MRAISLQSGSSGNCIYIESGGVRLLFDAGICGSQAEKRLAACGRDIRQVDAVIISHDHADHISHAGVYQRKYGLPIYVTPRTLSSAERNFRLGRLTDVHLFMAGGDIRFGEVSVRTIPTPHDGSDGSVFVVRAGKKRLGIMTDVGHVFEELRREMADLDAVFIESNYDPEMLKTGPYPAFLKKRIKGPKGHISNLESAELLLSGSRLKWACLAHLSENNNTVGLALGTHRRVLGTGLKLYAAGRRSATGILSL